MDGLVLFPLRILFICHDGDLYGSQQSLNLIIKHLPRDRYQCFVSIARPGPLRKLLENYPNTWVLAHKRVQWVKHDARNGLQKIKDCLTLPLGAIPRIWHLCRVIRREKINLVHTNSTVSLEGALAAAITGIPHIWHIRELFMEKSPKFHLILGRRFSRWLIDRFADRVICISSAVHQQFGAYASEDPNKYQLIHNALELPSPSSDKRFSDDTEPQPIRRSMALNLLGLPEIQTFRIGYIGRLSVGKGFHDLLDAFIALRKRRIECELLVAGHFVDRAYEHRILATIEREQLGHTVRLLGYQQNLKPLYDGLDVLVVPSINEPFGRVVIEAMANGLPCIATQSGGIPEIIDHGITGLMYPPGEVAALVSLIEDVMGAAGKLETIQQNARRMVYERFNIETQVRKLDECYQSVMAHHQLL